MATQRYYLGIDNGGTLSKAALYDESGPYFIRLENGSFDVTSRIYRMKYGRNVVADAKCAFVDRYSDQ